MAGFHWSWPNGFPRLRCGACFSNYVPSEHDRLSRGAGPKRRVFSGSRGGCQCCAKRSGFQWCQSCAMTDDLFSKLFEDYPLTVTDKLRAPLPAVAAATLPSPLAPATASATAALSPNPPATFASAAQLFSLPQQQQQQQQPKKIRRLPRDVIKAGEYGPEYEEWRRKEEEKEERERKLAEEAALRAAMPPGTGAAEAAPMVPEKQHKQEKDKATRPPRSKQSSANGCKMKMEVVERGVPKKQWFLIKWLVAEDKTSEDGDAIVLFEEDLKMSREVWSLSLMHRKPRGSTHCQKDSKIGRYFGAYVKSDGSVLCRSSTVLIGPKVLIRAELKGTSVAVKYRIDAKEQSSWDWIGLFYSTQEENYADYVTWCYVDTSADNVLLEAPVTPGDYVVCYFSSQKKFCPMAFSNFVSLPDANELVLEGEGVYEPGFKVTASINIKSHSRDANDWVGLYRYHQHKKHLFLASYVLVLFASISILICCLPLQCDGGPNGAACRPRDSPDVCGSMRHGIRASLCVDKCGASHGRGRHYLICPISDQEARLRKKNDKKWRLL